MPIYDDFCFPVNSYMDYNIGIPFKMLSEFGKLIFSNFDDRYR